MNYDAALEEDILCDHAYGTTRMRTHDICKLPTWIT